MASSAQHRRGDGPTLSLGLLSMEKNRAVFSGGLNVEVDAAVLSKLGLSPSRVEEADVGESARRNGWGGAPSFDVDEREV